MLRVIKRSGSEQYFDIEKIKTSIAAASDELRQPLGSSDIDQLAKEVKESVAGKDQVTTKELYGILVSTMRQQGFNELASAYVANSSNYWA